MSVLLPFTAGLLAAVAGGFTKCAMDSEQRGCLLQIGFHGDTCPFVNKDSFLSCEEVIFLMRAAWFILMVITNAYMLELFVKSLHTVGSLPATVVHLVANFCCTALIGSWAFTERLGSNWAFGAAIMACGVVLVQYGMGSAVDPNMKEKNHEHHE